MWLDRGVKTKLFLKIQTPITAGRRLSSVNINCPRLLVIIVELYISKVRWRWHNMPRTKLTGQLPAARMSVTHCAANGV